MRSGFPASLFVLGLLTVAWLNRSRSDQQRATFEAADSAFTARNDSLWLLLYRPARSLPSTNIVYWASSRAVPAARLAAASAARLARSAVDLAPEAPETGAIQVNADVMSANAISAARNLDEAMMELAKAPPMPRVKKGKAVDKATLEKIAAAEKAASFRVTLFFAQFQEQRRLAEEIIATAGRLRNNTPALREGRIDRTIEALRGDVTSGVFRTLIIAAAISVIVFAATTPIAAVFKGEKLPDGEVRTIKAWEWGPLAAAAAVPILATPYFVATTFAAATPSDQIGRRSHGDVITTIGPKTTNTYSEPTNSLPYFEPVAVEDPTEARVARESMLSAIDSQQRALAQQVQLIDNVVQVVRGAVTVIARQSYNDSVTTRRLATTDRDRRDALARDSVMAQALLASANNFSAAARALVAEDRSLMPALNTLTAVNWMSECLRLREGKRSVFVRGWRSLTGSDDRTRAMDAVGGADKDGALKAKRICDSVADLTPARTASATP